MPSESAIECLIDQSRQHQVPSARRVAYMYPTSGSSSEGARVRTSYPDERRK